MAFSTSPQKSTFFPFNRAVFYFILFWVTTSNFIGEVVHHHQQKPKLGRE